MNLIELENHLKTLTVKHLKEICVNTQSNNHVYTSHSVYEGYSRLNKKALIECMIEYQSRYEKPELSDKYVPSVKFMEKGRYITGRVYKTYDFKCNKIIEKTLINEDFKEEKW